MGKENRLQNGKGAKDPIKTLKRLLGYTISRYKAAGFFVVIFVILSSAANIVSVSRLAPIASELMKNGKHSDMSYIYSNIMIMGIIYLIGALSSFIYTRIMVYIAQGTLRKLRDEMFQKMQYFPLKFFDTNTHGNLMSLYTNDVDTMRQLLSQTIPQLITSTITMVIAIVYMI